MHPWVFDDFDLKPQSLQSLPFACEITPGVSRTQCDQLWRSLRPSRDDRGRCCGRKVEMQFRKLLDSGKTRDMKYAVPEVPYATWGSAAGNSD